MNHFKSRRGVLQAEAIPLPALAKAWGTPAYVYSSATLTRHWKVLHRSLRGIDHTVCYAVKANSNLSILSLFARLGSGFDIVSAGELYRVMKAGGAPRRVVYSGVGKRDDEIAFALDAGVGTINVESAAELGRISAVARRLQQRAPIAFRVNPDVDPKTHPYISTGLKKSKFGIHIQRSIEDYRRAQQMPHLKVVGVDCHIGSQLTESQPFLDALDKVLELVNALEAEGIHLHHIDLGGGLGICYHDEHPPEPSEYIAAILARLGKHHYEILLEPGRAIAGMLASW